MKIVKIYPTSINERLIDEAVDHLRHGGIIIYPTDTLYAIGCNALDNKAIEKVCRIKGINPQRESLSVVCCDISQASEYARIDNNAFRCLKQYLPGPFTFILPSATTLPKVFKGRKTVGVRIPDNAIVRRLAEALGNPLLSTSVEFDPDESADGVEPEAIAMRYATDADMLIDGGTGGTEGSTVVDLTDSSDPAILRQGKGLFE